MIEPEQMQAKTDAELCDAYIKLGYAEDELHAERTAIREEMAARLQDRKEDSTIADNKYTITRFQKVAFKPTLVQARELGAVKTVEQVDTTKCRTLHEAGVEVPGTKVTYDVRITPIKEQE